MRQAQYSARTLSIRIMRGGLAAPEIATPLAEGFPDAVHPIPVKSEGVLLDPSQNWKRLITP
jgi:hypothetical protein